MSQTTLDQPAIVAPTLRRPSLRDAYPLSAGQAIWGHRVAGLVLFILSSGLLSVAMRLTPDPSGMGTHEQLRLPPCGFLALTHLPCATCGMTTAFAHAAHGNILASFHAQFAGAILAIMTAMAVWVGGYAMVRGISLLPIGRLLCKPKPLIAMGCLVLFAWALKVLCVYGVL